MRRLAALVLGALAPLAAAAPAAALEQQAAAHSSTSFTTTELVAFTGDTLRFTNVDPISGHDLDSVTPGLFDSPVVGTGQSTLVDGVSSLSPGEYAFHCSIHPNMTGRLTVLDGDAPDLPGLPPEPPGPGDTPNPVESLPRVPPAPLGPGDWPSYSRDLSNSRNAGTAGPSYNEVPRLGPVWTYRSDDGDFTGTPVVAGGLLVAGSRGGTVHALDASTGALEWKRDFDELINASAAISGGSVYVPFGEGGHPTVRALDLATGDLLWTHVTDTQPTADSYGSPTVWDGKVFIGTSGYFGEQVSEVDVQARGSIVAMDAATGARLWKTYTVPEGSDGGAVWSTAAVDPETRRLYVGTGNAYHQPVAGHTDSMLALDADTGDVAASFQAVANDAWNGAEDWPVNPDADFGASANLFTLPDGRKVVGEGEKNGIYWVRERDDLDPVWSTLIGPGHFTGGVIGTTAVDSKRVYGPNTQGGEVWSLTRADGLPAWVSSDGGPLHFAAVSVANGVVYSNDISGLMTARDSTTGAILNRIPLGAPAWGGVSIAGGYVFTNTGTGGTAGYILAFRPR